jgi:hypothetical protein
MPFKLAFKYVTAGYKDRYKAAVAGAGELMTVQYETLVPLAFVPVDGQRLWFH